MWRQIRYERRYEGKKGEKESQRKETVKMNISLKDIIALISLVITFGWGVLYLSNIFHNLDTRIQMLDGNIKTVLVQVQALDDVQSAKVNARLDLVELQLKTCGCNAHNAGHP